ncbi:MAG: hypothetical protein WKF30_15550 [Pyrinomonadaceae bacterium]
MTWAKEINRDGKPVILPDEPYARRRLHLPRRGGRHQLVVAFV